MPTINTYPFIRNGSNSRIDFRVALEILWYNQTIIIVREKFVRFNFLVCRLYVTFSTFSIIQL